MAGQLLAMSVVTSRAECGCGNHLHIMKTWDVPVVLLPPLDTKDDKTQGFYNFIVLSLKASISHADGHLLSETRVAKIAD